MRTRVVTYGVLTLGALAFLFPFYYMVVGSLQTSPDTSIAGAFPHPSNPVSYTHLTLPTILLV